MRASRTCSPSPSSAPALAPSRTRSYGALYITTKGRPQSMEAASLRLRRLVPALPNERGDLSGEGFLPGAEGFDLGL